jgi:hypothetical protein
MDQSTERAITLEEWLWKITWIQAFPTLSFEDEEVSSVANNRAWAFHIAYPFRSISDDSAPNADITISTKDNFCGDESIENYDGSLGYGEITESAVFQIACAIQKGSSDLCCKVHAVIDLGSGSGRVLMAAAWLLKPERVTGIETMDNLHKMAVGRYQKFVQESALPSSDGSATTWELYHGDFTKMIHWISWTREGTCVIFVHGTVFEPELIHKTQALCAQTASGTYIVSVSHRFPMEFFQLVTELDVELSWGRGVIFIYKTR